jgi:hypothetical protein
MWDFSLLTATRSIEASMPFLLYRLMVYLGVSLGYLLAALAGAGTAIAFASFSANPTAMASFGAVIGFIACGVLLHKLRADLFFNVKAGHLVLLTEQVKGLKLPEGKAQIELAKQSALQRFSSPSVFFDLSHSTRQVLTALAGNYWPYLHTVKNGLVAKCFAFVAGRLAATNDQAILALHLLQDGDNPWRSAQTGLILQTRHFPWMLKNRLYLLFFESLGLLTAFTVILVPITNIAAALPISVGVWRFVFALVFAWSLKATFFEPIATAAMTRLYSELAAREETATDVEVEELGRLCAAFGTIREKAA